MTLDEIVAAILDGEDVERIDRLAQKRGVTREQMLGTLVRTGLTVLEEVPPATERRPKGHSS